MKLRIAWDFIIIIIIITVLFSFFFLSRIIPQCKEEKLLQIKSFFFFFFLYKITRLILSFPFPYSPFDRSKIRNIIGHQRTIMCTISRWKEEKIWSPVLIIHIHPSLCIGSRYLATFLSMSGQSTLSQPAFTTDKTRGDYSRSIIRTKRLVVSISVSPDSSFSS